MLNSIFNRTRDIVLKQLLNEFEVDYCTILIVHKSKFKVFSSNVANKYHKDLEEYVSLITSSLEFEAQIRTSKTNLSYAKDRSVQYCFLIPYVADNKIKAAILLENIEIRDMAYDEKSIFKKAIESLVSLIH